MGSGMHFGSIATICSKMLYAMLLRSMAQKASCATRRFGQTGRLRFIRAKMRQTWWKNTA